MKILELLNEKLKEGPLLPSIKESWKELSILTLLLSGGIAMCGGAVIPGVILLGTGAKWSIDSVIKS